MILPYRWLWKIRFRAKSADREFLNDYKKYNNFMIFIPSLAFPCLSLLLWL